MIIQILAFLAGAFLGAVITAAIYRSSQADNVRRAIASVQRYLSPDSIKPLGTLNSKLRLHLELINEADDLVSRSQWAKKHKRRFVVHAVDVIKVRNKGVTKANKAFLMDRQDIVKESGDLLLGYLQFPSWLWLKATLVRLINRSGAAEKLKLRMPGLKEQRQ